VPDITLIANFHSRSTATKFGEVQDALRGAGVGIAECHAVPRGKILSERLHEIVREGATEIIAVAGGDGSMTRAAQELAHRNHTLAVLPLGTGNSFAHSLGIHDVEEAVKTVATGECRKIDVGVVNGRYFANFATVGLTSEIAANTPDILKRVAGVGGYVLGGIMPALRKHRFTVKLRGKGVRFNGDVYQVIVASGRHFGEAPLLPQASVLSGRLAVFTTTAAGLTGVVQEFLAVARGRETELEQAHWWSTSKLKIRTSSPQLIAIDGKPIDKTPACFHIEPGALRVLVPRGFNGYP
jgi:YegS/Rv2252/BmrU family lipid kinase